MSLQYICGKCGKSCKNAGGLATHMKTHKKKSVASPSLLKFLKRTPAKKIPIELKPIKSKPRQVKFKSLATVLLALNKLIILFIGSEQAHNTVQMCTYKNASILI